MSQHENPTETGSHFGERVLVASFAVLAIYYGYETFQFRQTLDEDIVGPSTFPQLLAILALVLCAVYFVRYRHTLPDSESRAKRAAGELFDLIPVGITLVYVLLLEELGFPLATFIYITVVMRFFGEKWIPAATYGFFLMLVIFVIFYFGLQAFLPMGRWVPTEQLLPFLVDIRRAIGG